MNKKTILVCPLDWGLGHATRCVPLIRQFLKEGHQVIIGADKKPLTLLKQEFPQLKTIVIPGYEVKYGAKGSFLKLFYEGVKFYNFIKKEKQLIDEILKKYQIHRIVSDNRFGLYSDQVESILITHQIYPKVTLGETIVHKKISQLLNNFDEVWIPDHEGENKRSGDLAHLKPLKQKHRFIGPLSRFEKPNHQTALEFDVCAIFSGPEPQRTIFEELVLKQIKELGLKAVVFRGLPDDAREQDDFVFNHMPSQELQKFILKSKLVVCRSGYSSIMDLGVLEKRALLVPTPGQTEQEYLAAYHKTKSAFSAQIQGEFDLEHALKEIFYTD